MSRTRRERGAEQGSLGEGVFSVHGIGPSLLRALEEDEGLYPDALWYAKVWIRPEIVASWRGADKFLIGERDMKAFVQYVCPRLQERRRLREENEQLRQQLRDEQQKVVEARRACADATRESERLTELHARLQRDIQKARRGENEAREKASSLERTLRETEAAYEEEKTHFITAPDLVSSLRSLTDVVKTVHDEVRTSSEKTAELVAQRPPEGRRTVKTLHQMKRVLYDIGRFPRRRRGEAAVAADDGGGAIKRRRICYVCRCKGHLAKNCPRVRTVGATSSEPSLSDAQQRPAETSTEAASSSGWTIFSALRRFTSGVD